MRSLNTRYLLILSLAVLVMAVGCSNDDEEALSSLEGSWTFSSWTVDGVSQSNTDWYETDQTVRAELTLNANGTYTYREYNAANAVVDSSGGTYSISGSNITTIEDGETDTFNWSLTGNTLKISDTDDGHLFEMFWTRN